MFSWETSRAHHPLGPPRARLHLPRSSGVDEGIPHRSTWAPTASPSFSVWPGVRHCRPEPPTGPPPPQTRGPTRDFQVVSGQFVCVVLYLFSRAREENSNHTENLFFNRGYHHLRGRNVRGRKGVDSQGAIESAGVRAARAAAKSRWRHRLGAENHRALLRLRLPPHQPPSVASQ